MAKNKKANKSFPLVKTLLVLAVVSAFAVILLNSRVSTQLKNLACNTSSSDFATPIFTNSQDELKELADPGFTQKLFNEATSLEPALKRWGTQVHMGFWSGAGNHGNLVRLLDTINNYKSPDSVIHKAIWDEGSASSLQYPAYVRMNRQGWYERAYPESGKVTIFGSQYSDPDPIVQTEADIIWGEYSERYADLAVLFKEFTGKPVEVWCFIQGAKANRIFYTYEFPELQKLEKEGVVNVHYAVKDNADWLNTYDWITGTSNFPQPSS